MSLVDTLEGLEQRSVMSGGSVRGWLPDVSVVMWRRVLGLLGDPSNISQPARHATVWRHLLNLSQTLIKVRILRCF